MTTPRTPRAAGSPRVNIVFIGPPGSGKGTQAVRIAAKYGIPHISTGDILRAAVKAGSALGRQVSATLAGGGLVGDDLMTDLVRSRARAAGRAATAFCSMAFRRTVAQARTLESMLPGAPFIVALIAVADEAIDQTARQPADLRVVHHHPVGARGQRRPERLLPVLRRPPGPPPRRRTGDRSGGGWRTMPRSPSR